MICLLAVLCCFAVLADVIWEPSDSFYRGHLKECTHVGRTYTASGADGTVIVWKTPGSDTKMDTAKNGNTFFVSFTYKDKSGADWGVVEYTVDENGNTQSSDKTKAGDKTGWIPMKDLAVVYDNISFCNDHQSEFQSYHGEMDGYKIKKAVTLWTYPGSATYNTIDSIEKKPNISYTYTDKNGKQWGYLAYDKGARGWVCISAPEETPETSGTETAETFTSIVPEPQDNTIVILLAAFIIITVAVTAILISIFWKKKKNNV